MTRIHLSLVLASSLAAVALSGCSVHEPVEAKLEASSVSTATRADALEADAAPEAEPEAAEVALEERPMEPMAKRETRARPMSQPSPRPAPMPAMPVGRSGAVSGGLVADSRGLVGDVGLAPATTGGPVITEGGTRDYGVNGFDKTSEDHLSTFAVDVDTASYTMARKSLVAGYLPPASAVRVEEFVNYFPYEYERPAEGRPFTVDFEASPSPWDEQLTLLRVGVQGKPVSYAERKPVHLTFLVDTSGSMRSRDKLDLVKQALDMLTRELEDGDTVAIATYAGSTKPVLQPTSVSERAKILRSLNGLTSGGSTAMGSGIELAYAMADAAYTPGSVNRVIVCSDGDANVGNVDPDSLARSVKGYAEKGITLTTLGFGNGNYKDVMMERLANQGDGNYFYIDTEREARRVLVDKLSGTLEVIAKDVKIQVDFDPDVVEAYRLVGYENRDVADKDFRNDKVDAGEIGAGHQVTALYELVLRDGADGQIATVNVRHKAPGPDAPAAEGSWTLDTSAMRPMFTETSRAFRIAAASGYFAEVLRNSPHIREISLSQVAEIAEDAARPEYDEDRELVELIRTAARLRGENAVSAR